MRLRFHLLLAVLLAGALNPAAADEPKKLVAVINGEVLTAEDFDRMWSRLTPELRANYEQAGGKLVFLDNYIRKRLVIQEAIKQGFDKRSEVTFEIDQAREAVLFDQYIREVIASEVIPEMDLLAYYDSHPEEFQREEMLLASHIIAMPGRQPVTNSTGSDALTDEEALEKIKALAKQFKTVGGSFAEAARQFSEDPSAPLGGDLGWFGRGKMAPEFERFAFRLKVGDTSSVVKTQFGYHVILLRDRRPGGLASYDEVRGQIREKFLRERQAQIMAALSELTQQLKSASRVSVFRENME